MYSIYGTWTIEEARDVGGKYMARCIATRGYERQLTEGEVYEVTITERILPMTPLCFFMGDDGNPTEAHLERFEKVQS